MAQEEKERLCCLEKGGGSRRTQDLGVEVGGRTEQRRGKLRAAKRLTESGKGTRAKKHKQGVSFLFYCIRISEHQNFLK